MDLSDLTAYAKEKYHIEEQHKWAEFPGFSVLNDPRTGKWAALLMRQWDRETGTEIQRCDIKCGRQVLGQRKVPYLSGPFRMKGVSWVGVKFDDSTDPEVVCGLLDLAVNEGARGPYEIGAGERGASTIVLEELKGLKGLSRSAKIYGDTALPPAEERRITALPPAEERRTTALPPTGGQRTTAFPPAGERRATIVPPAGGRQNRYDQIPARIMEMMKLYRHGNGSFENKCRNFYVQGRFMEEYEDDFPWHGEMKRYFTTYHDLNANQLRGYFTWRAHVRKGEFRRITPSLAYLYLYELIGGIGTSSVEDTLVKMREFESGYLDAGFGDASMRENLHRWMMEYAVIHNAPPEYVLEHVDDDLLRRDEALLRLRRPQKCTDEELYEALSFVTGGKIENSPIITKEGERGKHLLAEVWKNLTENYDLNGWDIFTACFGKKKVFPWHPFANAVYYKDHKEEDREYVLSACRKYVCSNGMWTEVRYDDLFFDKYRIHAVVHEADRQLRRYLKTGRYLRAKKEEEWVSPFVEAVTQADRAAVLEAEREAERAAAEAVKPKVTIDLSGLDRIRRDAAITRESLLTEDEKAEFREDQPAPVRIEIPDPGPAELLIATNPPLLAEPQAPAEPQTTAEIAGLDSVHTQILAAVMRGDAIAELIREHHLMPSVVADAINEALFDEIGDNVLICDGNEIELVEDYRMDLEDLLGDI